jgi:8-oxo-dGTP pyrophosphatase MutT (NUDIX family)
MKMLASIRPEDVDPTSPHFDYSTYKTRTAGRAIIFDGDNVALIHVSKHGYYMLPGGGVEDEDIPVALAREIMEEMGCTADIEKEVGTIEVYFDRWQQVQTDHCFTARKTGDNGTVTLTGHEIEEGFETIWADSLAEAIRLVTESRPQERDGKLVQARDLLFLKVAAESH